MAVRFIVGKPGGGKTLYAVKLIIEELVYTAKTVVTNIPLELGRLNEYLQEKYPKESIDLLERLVMLEDEDVFDFYTFRSGGLILERGDRDEEKKLRKPEFIDMMKTRFKAILEKDEYRTPCTYFIDEAHNYFNAREWMEIGKGLLYYISQHRHLHDNCYFLTQALDNVEKQLKSVTQDYLKLRNGYKESFGPFKKPGKFSIKMFYEEPKSDSNQTPYNELSFTIDIPGTASCYQTTGALGIGSAPEVDREPKKLPWWSLYVLGALGAIAAILVVMQIPKMAMGIFSKTSPIASNAFNVGQAPVQAPNINGIDGNDIQFTNTNVNEQPLDPNSSYVQVVSATVIGPHAHIRLTDGTVFDSEEHPIELITSNWVQIAGQKYFFREPHIKTLLEPIRYNSENSESGKLQ